MIEVEWWEHDDIGALAEAVAGDIAFIIDSAIEAKGQALVAFPGGNTPSLILPALAALKVDWRKVTIIPTDDRLVPAGDPRSTVSVLARTFLAKGARVVPLALDAGDTAEAGRAADAALQALDWPPDLVWLGMGSDGHTASIFAGPDLDAALNAPRARRAVGVTPDPMPADAPVARVTLTRGAILSARALLVVVIGDDKRALLEQAIEDGPSSPLPIGRVLADAEQAIDIHWCAG